MFDFEKSCMSFFVRLKPQDYLSSLPNIKKLMQKKLMQIFIDIKTKKLKNREYKN